MNLWTFGTLLFNKKGRLFCLFSSTQDMDATMHAITANTGIMSWDMSIMNQNVFRLMSMFNSFMPW